MESLVTCRSQLIQKHINVEWKVQLLNDTVKRCDNITLNTATP